VTRMTFNIFSCQIGKYLSYEHFHILYW